MQAVGGGEVPGCEIAATHRLGVLADRTDIAAHDDRPGVGGGVVQGLRQCGAPDTHAFSGAEVCLDAALAVEIGDSTKRLAPQGNTELLELPDGVRHEPLAAGLVDRTTATVDNHGVQPGPGRVRRGGQSRRSGAGHDQIGHDSLISAAFSALIRARKRKPLRTVKAKAVIQAVCTKGSAIPSATTAT